MIVELILFVLKWGVGARHNYTKQETLFYLTVCFGIIGLAFIGIVGMVAYEFWKKEKKLIINFFVCLIFSFLFFATIGDLIQVRWRIGTEVYLV